MAWASTVAMWVREFRGIQGQSSFQELLWPMQIRRRSCLMLAASSRLDFSCCACLVLMYTSVFSKRVRAAARSFFLRSTSSGFRAWYTLSAPISLNCEYGLMGLSFWL